jgi:hypothetical protein
MLHATQIGFCPYQCQCQLHHLQTLIVIDSERIRRGHGIRLVVDTDLMIWKFTSAIVVGVEEFVGRVLFLFAKMSKTISCGFCAKLVPR